jgi:[ribosomal protein S5]-alanine N-acetyltransferase
LNINLTITKTKKNDITIQTDRLKLRPYRSEDVKRVQEIISWEEVRRWTLNSPQNTESVNFWIKTRNRRRNTYSFAVELKETFEIIGHVEIRYEEKHNRGSLTYWIDKEHCRKGIGTEVLKTIIQFGIKHLGCHKVFAYSFVENHVSHIALKKSGLAFECVLKEHMVKDGVYRDICVHSTFQHNF